MRRAISIVIFMFLGCCMPPPLQKGDVSSLFSSIVSENKFLKVTASGIVQVNVNGEVHTGSIDVEWNDSGAFNATFYGPLGITLGSIRATATQGTVKFDEGAYTFSPMQTMDSLPFAWGSRITFGELEEILLGRIPVIYASRLQEKPDSIFNGPRTIFALWETDSMEIRTEVQKRSQQLGAVTFFYKKSMPFPRVTLSSFKEKQAHKIELRENDRNYFSIKYTSVKCY
jgi:hypothetical protein